MSESALSEEQGLQTKEPDLMALNSKELSQSHRETSTLEEPIDEDLVLGTAENVEEQKESKQQKEIMSSEPVQSLQLPEPVVLISHKSLSDVDTVEEMEIGDNVLMVPSELADDAMANIQLIHEMERAANSRNEGLLIDLLRCRMLKMKKCWQQNLKKSKREKKRRTGIRQTAENCCLPILNL